MCDEPISLIKKRSLIEDLGFVCVVTKSLEGASERVSNEQFGVIISLVFVGGLFSIDVFEATKISCPIIFVADKPEVVWIDKIRKFPYATIIEKPLRSFTLQSTILRLQNEILTKPTPLKSEKSIEVSVGYAKTKEVFLSDIIYLRVEGAYTSICLKNTKYVQRVSFRKLLPKLDERFIQIHQSFVVNSDYNFSLTPDKKSLELNGFFLKISRRYSKYIIDHF